MSTNKKYRNNSPVHGFVLVGQNRKVYGVNKIIFEGANIPRNSRNLAALHKILSIIEQIRKNNLGPKTSVGYGSHAHALKQTTNALARIPINVKNIRIPKTIKLLKYPYHRFMPSVLNLNSTPKERNELLNSIRQNDPLPAIAQNQMAAIARMVPRMVGIKREREPTLNEKRKEAAKKRAQAAK